MAGLVLVVVGVGDEHRREPVERQHAVGLRVAEGRRTAGRLERLVVGMIVSKGKMIEARCTLCGPIKVTTYMNRPNRMGFTRPLDNPAVQEQLKRLDCSCYGRYP